MTGSGPLYRPGCRLAAWWLVFEDVSPDTPAGWLVRWLPGRHRHVWMARYDGEGRWLRVSADACGLDVSTWPVPDGVDYLGEVMRPGSVAVLVEGWTDPNRFRVRGPLTCVALAKLALGVRAPLAWTPGSLLRYLEARRRIVARRCA